MEYSNLTLPVGIFLVVVFFILLLRRSRVKNDSGQSYVKKGDGSAQELYEDKYREKNPLTKDEKIEKSWEYLYEITDVVLNNFSEQDKTAIHDIGHKLIDSGAGYEHVVEYGLKQKKKQSKIVEAQKAQNAAQEKTVAR